MVLEVTQLSHLDKIKKGDKVLHKIKIKIGTILSDHLDENLVFIDWGDGPDVCRKENLMLIKTD